MEWAWELVVGRLSEGKSVVMDLVQSMEGSLVGDVNRGDDVASVDANTDNG